MSMTGYLRALTPDEAAAIRRLGHTFLKDDGPEERLLDIDKAWHGIHFLLTGTENDTKGPLGQAVLGGEEFGKDMGYGRPRLLSETDVRTVADALRALPREELATRFDADEMARLGIYPQIWDEGDDARDYILEYYDEMRSFYERAAQRGDAMLLYLL